MATIGIDRKEAEALFTQALASELITALPRNSMAMQMLNVIPMGDKQTRIPVLSALPTARFLATEQEAKPNTAVAWDQVMLTAEEIAVIVPIDETVLEDAKADVMGRTTQLILQEFGRVLDAAVFFGTNAPVTYPKGGVFGAARKTVAASDTPSEDFNNAFGIVEEIDQEVDAVFGARTMKARLRGQVSNVGVPIYIPTEGNPNLGSIYGVPTSFPLGWDKTKAEAIVMNRNTAVLGLRSDIKTKILTEASLTGFGNLAERDSIAIRAVMRVGFAIANPASINNTARELPIAAITPKAAAK